MADADAVLSLAALNNWTYRGTALAVLGHPIKHSISPAMHNAALAELAKTDARFADWRYFRFDVTPEELPSALKQLHANRFRGLNLTVPHKVIAFEHLAEIDAAAQPVGAVNTLRATPNGWEGFNTDGYGLATGIREDLGLDVAGADIVLLGAGGAARSAAFECLQRRCRSLWIGNRTAATLEILLRDLQPHAGGVTIKGFALGTPPQALPAGAVVINATSAGLRAGDPRPIDLAQLSRPAGVFDMIYNPPETPLLAQARSLGILASNGLSMLIHQGARALSLWTGASTPLQTMRLAANAAIRR